jgi:cathepsin L
MATLARDGKAASIPILAPQQLVDCAPNPKHCGGTGGCEGSTQPLAFDYLVMAKGHDSEADYPYKGRDGTCEDGKHTPKIGITGKVELPTNNYTSLMHALVTAGPIAISVDASWGAYEGGVFSDPMSGIHTNIDHAVQLVGYGTMGGKDYWLVRNSWGASWGEQGYIKIERFGEGKEPCGTDARPGDGFGCAGGPSTIQVCGTSGILSGSSYPTGAHLL